MHGQGTLRWASGERYDGEWVEGEEQGLGVFTWRDGTTYDGFWQSGKKHGIGVCGRTVRCVLDKHIQTDSKPLQMCCPHACATLLAAVGRGSMSEVRWS